MLYLGLDIGTSSTKCVVSDADGRVLFSTAPAYEYRTPRPLWAESDPADWWTATVAALRAVVARFPGADFAGIGLTGQMHGLVLLDAAGAVVRPCIMWNDQRTAAECAALTTELGFATVLRITGNPILPGFTAPKIRWVQTHEPEAWARTAHVLLPKDYIRYRLSGIFATDVSDASGMALLDVGRRTWSPEMLAACRLRPEMLPRVDESVSVTARLSAEAAAILGLKAGIPIVAGAGDQAAGAVGSGIVRPGLVSCSLGTSGVLFAHSETFAPEPEGRLHAFCAAVPGKWHHMGVQLSCAGSYQWFKRTLGGGLDYPELNALAAQVPAGSEGLLFLPYLTGERCPHPDPLATGAFVGLTVRHGLGHLARAVQEGVGYGLRDALELMRGLGLRPGRIIVSGGGAKSELWRQTLADTFETPLATVNATEGGAFGAALLAMVGTGAHASVEVACDTAIRLTGETRPGPDVAAHAAQYARYTKLYPALRGV